MQQYMLGADQLENSSAEKDQDILVDKKLTMTHQCTTVAKASSLLGCTGRSVSSRLRERTLLLCSVLVSTHQEFWVQFWAFQYKSNMDHVP